MSKRNVSNSGSEESESEEKLSEEEEEEEEEVNPKQKQQGISEYEKQRLSRIAENKARMEALGLSKMASSLMGSSRNSSPYSSKLKGKRKVVEDDEDYRPNDEDDNDDDDDDDNDDKLDGDDDEDFTGNKTPQSLYRKNKVKNKVSKPKKKAHVQKHLSSSDYVDDDDELMKAIALSLQDYGEVSGAVRNDVQHATLTERKGNAQLKRKKSFTSRVQMTEDEMVVHFFQFDEAGKGNISMRDLRRVAIAHDFMWTDKELSDMIYCFDSDGDGKLNLDDFRKIVSRCNMLRTSENS
ncbi:uncharacterized protein DDB_G0283697-like [Durio zibethinus]|uniref:Uncharacterized protein DDB_G0283697-like n=1 Tax=Durio zibethinus TaxID=66656 RepID=A0A6P5ZX58_DURZI|nr:uncharacterized protein DDB_G0283697-like [Durio zibethinus]